LLESRFFMILVILRPDKPVFFLKLSDFHDSQYIQNGRNQNQHDADRCNILDNHHKELFGLELPVLCNFVDHCFGLDNVPDKNTGQNCHHRHHHAVGDEVEEIKELEAQKPDIRPDSVAQGGRNPHQQAEYKYHDSI